MQVEFTKKVNEKPGVISSGIPSMDRALYRGGFDPGTLVLIVGDASSRKDLFGYHFIRDGLEKGETVLFFDVEASSDEILDLVKSDEDLATRKNLLFIDACPEYTKFYINAAPAKVLDNLKNIPNVKRVLINPLTFFVEKFGVEDAGDFLIKIRNLAMENGFTVELLLATVLNPLDLQSIIDKCDGVVELSSTYKAKEEYHTLHIRKFGAKQREVVLSYSVMEKDLMIQTTDRIL